MINIYQNILKSLESLKNNRDFVIILEYNFTKTILTTVFDTFASLLETFLKNLVTSLPT